MWPWLSAVGGIAALSLTALLYREKWRLARAKGDLKYQRSLVAAYRDNLEAASTELTRTRAAAQEVEHAHLAEIEALEADSASRDIGGDVLARWRSVLRSPKTSSGSPLDAHLSKRSSPSGA